MKRICITAAACAASVLALAACSSSGGSSSANSAVLGASTAKGAPILIGLIAPTNSTILAYPQARQAEEVAIRAINAAGGIKGRPLELEYCDDQSNPQLDTQCAQKLLIDDHVVAFVGNNAPFSGGSFYPILAAAHTINFGEFPNTPEDLTNTLSYPFASGSGALALIPGALPQGTGRKYDFIVYDGYQSLVESELGPGLKAKGYDLHVITVDPTSKDYSIPAAEVARDKPAYVQIGTSDTDAAAVTQAFVAAGIGAGTGTKYLYISSILSTSMVQGIAEAGVNPTSIIVDFSLSESQTPLLRTYYDQVAKYGKMFGLTQVGAVSEQAITSWLAVTDFAKVAAQLKTINGPSLKTYMDAQTAFDTGLTHPLNFTKPGAVASLPRMFNTWIHTGYIDASTKTLVDNSAGWISGTS